jgi:5-oxoprolinase (ATP-hydrolysing)
MREISAARAGDGGIVPRNGFTQISVSHEVSPLIKLVGRGDTTVVDAYLSPILAAMSPSGGRVAAAARQMSPDRPARLMFMMSSAA